MSNPINTVYGRIPLFNGENYATWRPQMEGILHKYRFLKVVKGKETRPTVVGQEQEKWDDKDMDARSELLLAMEPQIVALVKNFKTSKEVWDFLESSYDRKSVRQKVEEFRKLLNTRMTATQTMDEYLREFNAVVTRLTELDAKLDNDLLVVILLDSLDENFKDVQAAFDAQKDSPSLDTVRIRLLEVGDKVRDLSNNNAMRVRGHFSHYSPNFSKPKQLQSSLSFRTKYCNYNCRRCGRRGHKARDCRSYSEKAKQVDDEGTSEQGFVMKEFLHLSPPKALEAAVKLQGKQTHWCLDSGATSHMCYDEEAFMNLSKGHIGYVKLANDKKVRIMGIGNIKICSEVNNEIQFCYLYKTLFVPDLKENLVSINKATMKGGKVIFEGDSAKVTDKNEKILMQAKREGGLYIVHSIKEVVNQMRESKFEKGSDNFTRWHNRMGHLNAASLKQLQRENMVSGLPKFESLEFNCTACIQGKQTRLPFISKQEKSTTRCLELVHSDICGPMKKESLSKSLYFVTFIDDYSRKIFVYFIRKKSELLDKFKQFKTYVENQTNLKIKRIRSDNGSEYTSKNFREFCRSWGIKQEFSAEYTPQQNGVAERANRTLIEMARCMMIKAKLPEFLWAELVHTSAYIRNRCPTKLNKNKTPEELWSTKVPSVSYFKEIGSQAFVLKKGGNYSKFEPKSEEFVLTGYCDDAKAYRLWKRGSRSIIKSRDVAFIENLGLQKENEFYEFELQSEPNEELELKFNEEIKPIVEVEVDNCTKTVNDELNAKENSDESDNSEEFFSNNSDHASSNSEITEADTDKPGKIKPANVTTRSPRPFRKVRIQNTKEAANFVSAPDPKSLKEVHMSENVDEWMEAMNTEMELLNKNKTWDIVDRPEDKDIIGCRWIFKTKRKPDGTVERRKARLVAQGYTQVYGVDYFETFAPVAEISSIRILYAIATEYNLDLHHIDVSTAFLYGDLEEEIYMEQPAGFENENNKVCKLKKSIYGLKQSGHQWNKKLDSKLRQIGLINSNYDRCIYFKKNQGTMTYIAAYVDDLIIATNDSTYYKALKSHLENEFDIRDLGEPKLTIGLEITRDRLRGTLSISQSSYIRNLLKDYNLFNCSPRKLPMPPKTKLEKEPRIDGEKQQVNQRNYQKLIGSLLHLSIFSRPDIAYYVNILSQFNQDPRKQHWNYAISILRYLKGTQNARITYRKTRKTICAYADSDWAEDVNDRKSQSGIVFVLAGAAIDWESHKQSIITMSSAEAEYITLTTAAKRAKYFKLLLTELGLHPEDEPVILYTDSQSAQYIANYQGNRSRTKHLHIRYHYIREAITDGTVYLKYLPTNDMLADALTKCTSTSKHHYCFEELGMN